MDVLRLDMNGLLDYQANRPPFLMIDEAFEVVPGQSAKGFKRLPPDTWFFEPHFPGDPLMPGLLQIEALVQLAALMITTMPGLKGSICYLVKAQSLDVKRRVVPGDQLDLSARMLSFKHGLARCEGEGTVRGEAACRAEFTLVVPAIFDRLRPKAP